MAKAGMFTPSAANPLGLAANRKSDRYAQPFAAVALGNRGLGAVKIGNALDDGKTETAADSLLPSTR